MEDKRYDPYTGYEIKDEDQRQESQQEYENTSYDNAYTQQETNVDQQAQTSGIALAAMILGIISVVCMVSCCCTPIAIITGIAAIICFAVTPKVNQTRGKKAKAGLICGIIGIIGSVILITVFVVNILLSSDFQNEMKEFNTHYDTYIDENDDSI